MGKKIQFTRLSEECIRYFIQETFKDEPHLKRITFTFVDDSLPILQKITENKANAYDPEKINKELGLCDAD